MDIRDMTITIIGLILLAYISYVLISSLSTTTPGFAPSGWEIYAAIVAAIVAAIAIIFKGWGTRRG